MIKPFAIGTMAGILRDYKIKNTSVLFDYYLFTGGSPKYIDQLVENQAFTFEKILNFAVEANSPSLNEGRNLLIEEFGKEYGTYFSILELIAAGKTARTEIESLLEVDIGGYLDRLENSFDLVSNIKLNPAKLNLALLKSKATSLLQSYPGHHPQWLGLSLANLADYL